jgi:hypothetical protein
MTEVCPVVGGELVADGTTVATELEAGPLEDGPLMGACGSGGIGACVDGFAVAATAVGVVVGGAVWVGGSSIMATNAVGGHPRLCWSGVSLLQKRQHVVKPCAAQRWHLLDSHCCDRSC